MFLPVDFRRPTGSGPGNSAQQRALGQFDLVDLAIEEGDEGPVLEDQRAAQARGIQGIRPEAVARPDVDGCESQGIGRQDQHQFGPACFGRKAYGQSGGVDADAHGPQGVAVALAQAIQNSPSQGQDHPVLRRHHRGPGNQWLDEQTRTQVFAAGARPGSPTFLGDESDGIQPSLVKFADQVLDVLVLVEFLGSSRLFLEKTAHLLDGLRGRLGHQFAQPFQHILSVYQACQFQAESVIPFGEVRVVLLGEPSSIVQFG